MSEELTCTLGYHSQTQWLVQPQIILLYDKMEMNKPIYDMLIGRERARSSSLDILLSQLLHKYEREGIITVVDYTPQITSYDRELVEQLILYWEREIPHEFGGLAIELLKARQEHTKRKRQFLEVTEPMYKEMTEDLRVREERIEQLRRGEIPLYAREGVKHCIEHVLFTDRLTGLGKKPVFEWSGYMFVRNWLVSVPSFPSVVKLFRQQTPLRQTTEAITLNAFIDLFVGSQDVTDEKQLEVILR